MKINRYVKEINMEITNPCYIFAYGVLMTPRGFRIVTGIDKYKDQFIPAILHDHKRGLTAGNGQYAFYGIKQEKGYAVMGTLVKILTWKILKHILIKNHVNGFEKNKNMVMYSLRDVTKYITSTQINGKYPVYALYTESSDIVKTCNLPVFYYHGIWADILKEYGAIFGAQFINSGGISTSTAIKEAEKRKNTLKKIKKEKVNGTNGK